MKIALFTDVFSPKIISGVVVSTISLAKGLADRGHKIYIIASKNSDKKEFKYKNVKVLRVPSIPALLYPEFKITTFYNHKIIKYLQKEKIDIVQFSTPLSIGLMAILISKKLKVPLVGTFHTSPTNLKMALSLDYKIIEKIIWRYVGFYYKKCDVITCPSETILNEMLKNEIKAKRNVFISNGIDKKEFDNSKSKKLKEKCNPDGNLILFVGRVSPEKNIFYLLEIFKMIAERLPKTKMLFVGDGPQMNEVKNKIKDFGLSNHVILLGRIEHDKLVKSGIFGACDLFMTASLTETQGITTLESQINGLVCVGADAPGTKDLIKNNYNGFLVKDGNKEEFSKKVVKILTDKKLYNKMKRNTLKEIKKHEMSHVITQWENELLKLIKKNKTKDKKLYFF